MIKPDGVQRRVVGDIISRFEAKGYLLKALKLTTPDNQTLEEHYKDLKEKPFFPKLMKYMSSGPVVAMVWEGKNAVKTGRTMLGATNPLESAPGTIRGDYAIDVRHSRTIWPVDCEFLDLIQVGRNICHGSDSVESAQREIALWFKEGINEFASHSQEWIYE